jgi:hypothetical protein
MTEITKRTQTWPGLWQPSAPTFPTTRFTIAARDGLLLVRMITEGNQNV